MPRGRLDNWMSYEHQWYHWAPTERRAQIKRHGLLPNQWSRDKLWKPPYFCLAATPVLAENLSIFFAPEIKSWDLYQVYTGELGGYEELYHDNGQIKEIRVYERIYKRNVWLLATREA